MGQAGWGRAGNSKLGGQGGWVKPRPLLRNVVVAAVYRIMATVVDVVVVVVKTVFIPGEKQLSF